ncbi:hypothetical protein BJ973_003024 [Actinoplanes tereljensis]|uniref:hypothetical protein n=1 Tax=Paractinoplanes tereljensis TaxID=571912 RepID=UPI0019413AFD|nr:hypothetical protein [Actinoplanes tereljensis]
MSGDDFRPRQALLVLAGFWTVGVVLLVASLFGSVGLDRFRQAPTCSNSLVFTTAYCRITVDATLIALTREEIVMDVGARRVAIDSYLHGPLPDDVAGRPVRVTFYRGVVVHVEGGDLNFDTVAAPIDRTDELRFAGLFFLIGGTFLVGIDTLRRSARRADSP